MKILKSMLWCVSMMVLLWSRDSYGVVGGGTFPLPAAPAAGAPGAFPPPEMRIKRLDWGSALTTGPLIVRSSFDYLTRQSELIYAEGDLDCRSTQNGFQFTSPVTWTATDGAGNNVLGSIIIRVPGIEGMVAFHPPANAKPGDRYSVTAATANSSASLEIKITSMDTDSDNNGLVEPAVDDLVEETQAKRLTVGGERAEVRMTLPALAEVKIPHHSDVDHDGCIEEQLVNEVRIRLSWTAGPLRIWSAQTGGTEIENGRAYALAEFPATDTVWAEGVANGATDLTLDLFNVLLFPIDKVKFSVQSGGEMDFHLCSVSCTRRGLLPKICMGEEHELGLVNFPVGNSYYIVRFKNGNVKIKDTEGGYTQSSLLFYVSSGSVEKSFPIRGVNKGDEEVECRMIDSGNGTEGPNRLTDLPSIAGDERKTVVVQPAFYTVSFSGNSFHAVTSDQGGDPYTTQQWYLGRQKTVTLPDGTTFQHDDSSWPVCYTRNTTVSLSSGFQVPDDVQIDPPKIKLQARGQATAGTVTMKWTHDLVSFLSHSGTYAAKASDTALADTVQDILKVITAWEVSGDDGVTWHAADTTSVNRVYVTYKDPIVSPLNESFLSVSCGGAAGQHGTKDECIAAIWEVFKGLNVKNAEDQPLKYYEDIGPGAIPENIFPIVFDYVKNHCGDDRVMINPNGPTITNSPPGITAAQLISYLKNVGTCGAWAQFFQHTLQAQGFPDAIPSEITLRDKNAQETADSFYVFRALDGQNNVNPEFHFTAHSIVKIGGQPDSQGHLVGSRIYDPSYGFDYDPDPHPNLQGNGSDKAELAWQLKSVDKVRYLKANGQIGDKESLPNGKLVFKFKP